jgi:hypothetical protein
VDAGESWLKTQGAGGYDIRVLKLTNAATDAATADAQALHQRRHPCA